MALIEERKKERITSGSYERVLGNKKLGSLISMVHSTSISNGNELEKIILNKCKKVVKDAKELNSILQKEFDDSWDVIIVPKKVIKNSSIKNSMEPDFLIIQKSSETLNIIELKDGWVFDTKKVAGEYQQLINFQNEISKSISFITKIWICSFNNDSKEEIFLGLKSKVPIKHIMTGEEFCDLLNISKQEIQKERQRDSEKNLNFFVTELLKIDDVRNRIIEELSK
ncbi:hypothetical protein [Mycoplasma mycoides]|uniref:Uncharacterized protein n=1 Tax=Mycoplasma mycoides subsp. capri TaxID=40477 RepID=A0AB38GER9_MYCMC|nr:hypothetical protein [Mycoplasma mycoides]SRX59241.1 hypothetical protein MMC68K_00774 [Mycoplasma mycoides subsp. capri]SRX61914.1 hypothetical protein MMC68I_00777 [Mycoplasma mycoides subsp. capri]SRX63464.1 hypothetical protein MMC68N_00761 [Mycoplasma mycoides subsp. capri]SRX65012.1 hypothetical protein MMC68D_00765 [Mycoplasma mycoides subsp. capri]SRX65882.1 hypothetical protein MMC68L_00763 [Mycoplasma mycoides subsp. capri]